MQAIHMTNSKGMKSINNILIKDSRRNLFLQSYGEIVAIKHNGIAYIKEGGTKRSASTSRYIRYFIKDITEIEVIKDEDFLKLEATIWYITEDMTEE